MKQKTKKKIIEILTVVFIIGETRMYVAWALFILGLVIGGYLF